LIRRLSTPVLVALVVLIACSEGGAASSPTDPTTPSTTIADTTTTTSISTDAVEAFHECLGDNGIDIEPIPLDAQGRPRLDLVMIGVDLANPDSAAVVAGCSEHLSKGALDLSSSPLIGGGVNRTLTEFSDCVRSRGVPKFPDPLPGFTGIGGPYPVAEIPFSDPDLEAAIDECRSRLSAVDS
jgi:hypothetical protein